MTTQRLSRAVRKVIEGVRYPAQITSETVEAVRADGRYQVRGGVLAATGDAKLRAGDIVPVAWANGRPRHILRHHWRRSQPLRPRVEIGEIVEELFIADSIAFPGNRALYFRNYEREVEVVSIANVMGAPTEFTFRTRWGEDPDTFFVERTQSGSGTRHFFVYRIARPTPGAALPEGEALIVELLSETGPTFRAADTIDVYLSAEHVLYSTENTGTVALLRNVATDAVEWESETLTPPSGETDGSEWTDIKVIRAPSLEDTLLFLGVGSGGSSQGPRIGTAYSQLVSGARTLIHTGTFGTQDGPGGSPAVFMYTPYTTTQQIFWSVEYADFFAIPSGHANFSDLFLTSFPVGQTKLLGRDIYDFGEGPPYIESTAIDFLDQGYRPIMPGHLFKGPTASADPNGGLALTTKSDHHFLKGWEADGTITLDLAALVQDEALTEIGSLVNDRSDIQTTLGGIVTASKLAATHHVVEQ
jgi:hypothetical protein